MTLAIVVKQKKSRRVCSEGQILPADTRRSQLSKPACEGYHLFYLLSFSTFGEVKYDAFVKQVSEQLHELWEAVFDAYLLYVSVMSAW